MPATSALRALERFAPGGGERRRERARLAQLESQVTALGDQVRDVADSVERLRQTMVAADPELMREIVEALRSDVAGLTVEVNERLARSASLG